MEHLSKVTKSEQIQYKREATEAITTGKVTAVGLSKSLGVHILVVLDIDR